MLIFWLSVLLIIVAFVLGSLEGFVEGLMAALLTSVACFIVGVVLFFFFTAVTEVETYEEQVEISNVTLGQETVSTSTTVPTGNGQVMVIPGSSEESTISFVEVPTGEATKLNMEDVTIIYDDVYAHTLTTTYNHFNSFLPKLLFGDESWTDERVIILKGNEEL